MIKGKINLLFFFGVLLLGTIGAIALAGCGGSSNSTATTTAAGATTTTTAGSTTTTIAGGAPAIIADIYTGSFPSSVQLVGNAQISVQDAAHFDITNATVTLNGTTLSYEAAIGYYAGSVTIAAGAAINLSVTFGGTTYTGSATNFTTYPDVTTLPGGGSFSASQPQDISWSASNPSADSYDVYIGPHVLLTIPGTSCTIPAGYLTAGNQSVYVGAVKTATSGPISFLVIGYGASMSANVTP